MCIADLRRVNHLEDVFRSGALDGVQEVADVTMVVLMQSDSAQTLDVGKIACYMDEIHLSSPGCARSRAVAVRMSA